ncbi:MAG: primosomal protein N' [Sutterellaceae bacterium]|nr:primosomal protein N' [Sutterellaceae bacterium]
MALCFVEVFVDVPLPALDYAVPEDVTVTVGDRVVVPVGTRKTVGIVAAVKDTTQVPAKKIKPIVRVLNEVAPLSAEWMRFLAFAADYYIRFKGEAAVSALPQFFRTPPKARYEASLKRLRELKHKKVKPGERPPLNDEQQVAAQAITGAQGFVPFVLYGVTGSGKTEVYLHAIEEALKKSPDNQVLLLVPEINLTPQLEARVRGRFVDETVVTMHSGLTPVERARSWLAVHEGKARVLVGTRMAIFASFRKLGLIIVDEEHDQSYKAGEAMRFSARDLAVKRAMDNGIACVLGSATPSLETWAKVLARQYRCLRLSHRAVQAAHLPKLELVDVSKEKPQVFAQSVKDEIDATLLRKEQVLVFINRRGYAPVISCTACGWVSRCEHCSGFTVFHKNDRRLVCHHCGTSYRVPARCPSCGNPEIVAVGTGTQRIEEAIEALWPQARVLRIDRDSVKTKNAAETAFESVHAGDVDIVVGTQMIAKGHDFKRVGLVVVLNADAQLVSPDIRAEEHLYATLMQVAGRAGRDKIAGRVLIQTRFPEHPVYGDMQKGDYESFAQRLLKERQEAMSPPYAYQALLTAQSSHLERTIGFLRAARDAAVNLKFSSVFVYEPVPMSLMRLKDAERGQLLIETMNRRDRHAFLTAWDASLRSLTGVDAGVTWAIEVDPADI